MAYEHENTVVAELTSLGMEYHSNAHYEIAGEVKEVYAKAKAFDVIKKLEKETILYSVAGKEDVELGAEARKIINKYMEDK